MRRLLLLRHAKSAYPQGVADIDRPLGGRGLEAAPLMGDHMAREGLRPDHVLVSPARRTQETWAAIAPLLEAPPHETVPSIYEAASARILDAIRSAPDTARTLLVIGHNPGLAEAALRLIGTGPPALRRDLREKFPTAALVVIGFEEGAWATLTEGTGDLQRYVRPRQLAAEMDDD